MHRLSFKTLFLIVVFLLIPIVLLIRINQKPRTSSAAWWDEAWIYRRTIDINNATTAQSNVYITLSLDTSNTTRYQADAGDIRFTTTTGNLLDYFIVSGAGTASTVIHINYPTLPAGNSQLYLYYGNPAAVNGFSAADFSNAASSTTPGTPASEELSPGPVAYWKFDDGVGTTASDSSGHNYHAAFATGSSAPSWASADQCISGKCLLFGGNDYIIAGSSSRYGATDTPGSYTIEAWVKPTSVARYNIVAQGMAGMAYLATSSTGDARPISMIHNYNPSSNFFPRANGSLVANQWNHLVFVFNHLAGFQYYINGNLDYGVSSPDYGLYNYFSNTNIGYYVGDTTTGFIGYMDEFKVYKYNRTPAQIKADYNSGLAAQSSSQDTAVNFGSANNQSSAGGLSNGLVGYWKFNENSGTTSLDSTANNNTVTFAAGDSAPSWSSGKYGVGLSFNGTTSYASIAHNTALNPGNGSMTVAAWVYLSGTQASNQTGIFKKDGGTDYYVFEINSSYLLTYEARDNSGAGNIWSGSISAGNTLPTNTWSHIAWVLDRPTASISFYIDGQKISTSVLTGLDEDISPTLTATIGRHIGTLNGQIDELRYYNRALNPLEMRYLYNYAPPPIAEWKFDERSGTTVSDTSSSSSTNPITLNGSGWTVGKFGSAINLNGTSDYGRFNKNLLLNSSALTVSAWFKTTDADGAIVAEYQNSSSYTYKLVVTGGKLAGCISTVNADASCNQNTNLITSSSNVNDNKWHQAVLTYDGTQVKMFLDSTSIGTSGKTGNIASNYTNYSFVGLLGYDVGAGPVAQSLGYLSGSIDHIRIYNYARTQSQILQDMSASGGNTLNTKSMVAHYKLDEGVGTIINNSGNGGIGLSGAFGAAAAAPSWSNNGKVNKALSFNAANTTYTKTPITAANGLDIRGSITYSLWFKRNSATGYQTLVDMEDNCTTVDMDGYFLRFNNDSLVFQGNINDVAGTNPFSLSYTNASTTGDTSNWHHIIATWDGTTNTNGVKMYLDGKLAAQSTASATAANMPSLAGQNLSLGVLSCNAHANDGLIDEVKIYNYSLTEEEIKKDYNQNSSFVFGTSNQTIGSTTTSLDYCVPGDSSPCSPPIAEWKFDEKIGTTAYDSSGNGHNGLITNTSNITWKGSSVCKKGGCLNFNGSAGEVTFNTVLASNQTATYETWFKPNFTVGTTNVSVWSIDGSIDYLAFFNDNRLVANFHGPTSEQHFYYYNNISSQITSNSWVHVVETVDSTTGTVATYINGKLLGSSTSTSWVPTTSSTFRLGNPFPFGNFKGMIDEMRVYNYVRTPAQIAYDYNKGGPIAHWKLDECQGGIAYDSSGIGNTGSIIIGASGTQNALGTCSVGTSAAWTAGASGKFNGSLKFDGNDDYVDMGNSSIYDFTSAFSISTWVKPDMAALSGTPRILSRSLTTSSQGYILSPSGGAPRLLIGNGSSWTTATSSVTMTAGNWYHIVATWNGTNFSRIYVNGVQTGSAAPATITSPGSRPLIVGADSSPASYSKFSGLIDDTRVYNYELTSTQVKQIYNGGAVNFGN